MNETIAAVIGLALGRANSEREFILLDNMTEDFYLKEVITDFEVLVDLKTQIGVAYIEWLESNETEGNK